MADVSSITGLSGRIGAHRAATSGLVATVIAKGAYDVAALAQLLVRVDTGAAKNSIGVDISPDGLTAVAGPTVDYGPDLEYGTRPHVIRARGKANGGADALFWPGAAHPVVSVNHPGTKAYPFMRPAEDAVRPGVEAALTAIAFRVAG